MMDVMAVVDVGTKGKPSWPPWFLELLAVPVVVLTASSVLSFYLRVWRPDVAEMAKDAMSGAMVLWALIELMPTSYVLVVKQTGMVLVVLLELAY